MLLAHQFVNKFYKMRFYIRINVNKKSFKLITFKLIRELCLNFTQIIKRNNRTIYEFFFIFDNACEM